MLTAIAHATTDVDGPLRPGTRVQNRALALVDLEVTTEKVAHAEGGGAGGLVLGNVLLQDEEARAQNPRVLVEPRPAVDEAKAVRRSGECLDLAGASVLAQLHLRGPLRPRGDPGEVAGLPRRDVARRRSQPVARPVLAGDQPGRADERV